MARSSEEILKEIIGAFVIQIAVAQAAKENTDERVATLQRRVDELSATSTPPVPSN
mgnify:CR=1 FL=1